jgi:hypothetical protein
MVARNRRGCHEGGRDRNGALGFGDTLATLVWLGLKISLSQ